jgi:hypothetical protein
MAEPRHEANYRTFARVLVSPLTAAPECERGRTTDAAITWHVPGHSPLSGDFKGHDQIGGFFRRTMELSGGALSIDVHNVLAADDLVVALTTVNAQRNGVKASFPEVQQREDRFWS